MGFPGSSLNNRKTLPTMADEVYCTSASYYQVIALVIEEIWGVRAALDEERKVICGFLCQATFSQNWGGDL